MGTAESAAVAAEPTREGVVPRWALVRRCALVLYAVALVVYTLAIGVPVQRELVIGLTCGALACASIGRSGRQIVQLALDWMPLVLILAAYDYTRGFADSMGFGVHFTEMVDFDRLVFPGSTPTEWLQANLDQAGAVGPWDVFFTLVYTSYFIVPFAVAGVLWARHRRSFQQYTRRLVTLALAGLSTYILFPAAPPWMAAENGLLEGVERTTGRGWEAFSMGTAIAFKKGQASVNLVAAVPSLHLAFTALVAMFLWSRVRPAWRPLLALYPVAMGITLMATAEHYLFDIVLGAVYAALVMAGWRWWEARRLRSRTKPA